jgi:hypothetical protein
MRDAGCSRGGRPEQDGRGRGGRGFTRATEHLRARMRGEGGGGGGGGGGADGEARRSRGGSGRRARCSEERRGASRLRSCLPFLRWRLPSGQKSASSCLHLRKDALRAGPVRPLRPSSPLCAHLRSPLSSPGAGAARSAIGLRPNRSRARAGSSRSSVHRVRFACVAASTAFAIPWSTAAHVVPARSASRVSARPAAQSPVLSRRRGLPIPTTRARRVSPRARRRVGVPFRARHRTLLTLRERVRQASPARTPSSRFPHELLRVAVATWFSGLGIRNSEASRSAPPTGR